MAARRRGVLDLPVVAGLTWWLLVWRMLDWHLGMAEGGDGRPRPRLSTADAVTLARFWLVPALPAAAHAGAPLPAVIVAGGVTDWLDGTIARRDGRTRLGRDLDTTADLAFLTTAAMSAHRAGRLPDRVRNARRAPRDRAGGVVGRGVRSRAAPRDPCPAEGRAAALRRPGALRRRPAAGRHAGPGGGLLRPATLDDAFSVAGVTGDPPS